MVGAFIVYPEAILISGFMAAFGSYFVLTRRRMLGMRFIGCVCSFLFFLSCDAYSGAMASAIACIGTFVQIIVSERQLKKTLVLRSGIAVTLACIGIAIFYGSQSIFSLLASITARLSEVQSCTQRIRMGFMLGHVFWLTYMVQEGLLLPFVLESVLLVCCVLTFAQREHAKRKAPAIGLPA